MHLEHFFVIVDGQLQEAVGNRSCNIITEFFKSKEQAL